MPKITLFLLLCLYSLSGLSQSTKTPFRKANQIIVHSALSGEELYKKALQALISEGAVIEMVEADLQLITASVSHKYGNKVQMTISIDSNTAILTGQVGSGYFSASSYPADYRNKGSVHRIGFDVINKFAKELSEVVYYAKK